MDGGVTSAVVFLAGALSTVASDAMLLDVQLHREPHSLDVSLWSSWPDGSRSCITQFLGGTQEDDMIVFRCGSLRSVTTNSTAAAPQGHLAAWNH